MIPKSCSQDGKNSEHNVFRGISTRPNQEEIFSEFLAEQDVSPHTIQALTMDIKKFAKWFSTTNSSRIAFLISATDGMSFILASATGGVSVPDALRIGTKKGTI